MANRLSLRQELGETAYRELTRNMAMQQLERKKKTQSHFNPNERLRVNVPNLRTQPAVDDAIFEARIAGDTSPQARMEVSQRTGVPEEKLEYGSKGLGPYVLPAAIAAGGVALAANPVTGPIVGKLALAGLTTAFAKKNADHIFGEENVDEFIHNYVEPTTPYLAMNPQLVSGAAQSVRNTLGHYGANAIPRVQAFNRKAFPNAYQRHVAKYGYPIDLEPESAVTSQALVPVSPSVTATSPQVYSLPVNAPAVPAVVNSLPAPKTYPPIREIKLSHLFDRTRQSITLSNIVAADYANKIAALMRTNNEKGTITYSAFKNSAVEDMGEYTPYSGTGVQTEGPGIYQASDPMVFEAYQSFLPKDDWAGVINLAIAKKGGWSRGGAVDLKLDPLPITGNHEIAFGRHPSIPRKYQYVIPLSEGEAKENQYYRDRFQLGIAPSLLPIDSYWMALHDQLNQFLDPTNEQYSRFSPTEDFADLFMSEEMQALRDVSKHRKDNNLPYIDSAGGMARGYFAGVPTDYVNMLPPHYFYDTDYVKHEVSEPLLSIFKKTYKNYMINAEKQYSKLRKIVENKLPSFTETFNYDPTSAVYISRHGNINLVTNPNKVAVLGRLSNLTDSGKNTANSLALGKGAYPYAVSPTGYKKPYLYDGKYPLNMRVIEFIKKNHPDLILDGPAFYEHATGVPFNKQ